MKKIERAIEHLEAAVSHRNSHPPTNGYMRGLTEGLQQALNACREIATGEHQTYETVPPKPYVTPWQAGTLTGREQIAIERIQIPNWSWQRRAMGEKTVVD